MIFTKLSQIIRNFSYKLKYTSFFLRSLNLHEHHAKELLAYHDIRVQKGILAFNAKEAEINATKLRQMGAKSLICKSQILAGGRGKGVFDTGFKGGVKVCDSPEEINSVAKKMIGNRLITKQTISDGQFVQKVLIHEGIDFNFEFYFAILLDRSFNSPILVGSSIGGVNIEEVASKNPKKIKIIPISIKEGLTDGKCLELAKFMGFKETILNDTCKQMKGLYNLFMKNDCIQIEINPFIQTEANSLNSKVYCIDAKLDFDEFAEYRNKEIFNWKDVTMQDMREVIAKEIGLNYISLDGNIGCMVNGAGLAMATMDAISIYGGQPANFLDVGGSADQHQVEGAFKILVSDKNAKSILINIFGGIMKCDVIAMGIIKAIRKINLGKLGIPLIVRLSGTNEDIGKKLFKESGLLIQLANNLNDAAQKACSCLY